MVLNDAFMQSWQPAINNLYKQYGATYGNNAPPPDGALYQAKLGEAQRKSAYDSWIRKQSQPTYQDAVNALSNGTAPIGYDNTQGAYKQAESIRNDPTLQQKIKDSGYNLNDYINALYNVASKGKFASERAYNQYTKNLKSQVKNASNKMQYSQADQNAITSAVQGKPTQAAMVPTVSPSQQPQSGGLMGFLDGLGHDLQRGYDRLIVKPVSGLANAIDSGVQANHAIKSGQQKTPETWDQIKNAFMNGYNSNTPVSFSKVLNDMGSKNQTFNDLVGGATDFTMNPLNLIPYVGAEKLLGEGGLKVGSKLAQDLVPKFGNTIANGVGKGLEGMAAGALGSSVDASLNPHLTPQERLAEVLQMGSLGGIGGALHGGLEGISKSVGGRFNALDNLLHQAPLQSEAHTTPQDFLQATGEKALPAPGLPAPKTTLGNSKQLLELEKTMNDLHTQYAQGLKDHVDNGLAQSKQDFLNTVSDLHGKRSAEIEAYKPLANEYKTVKDAFPKGIQIPKANKNDFQLPPAFKAKKGSATDIYQAAEQLGKTPDQLVEHLHNLDAAHKLVNMPKKNLLGSSTLQQALNKASDHFDNKLAPKFQKQYEAGFHETPDAQAMQRTLGTLEAHHQDLSANRPQVPLAYVGNNEHPIGFRGRGQEPANIQELSGLPRQHEPQEKAINIDQAPQPVKLSPKELQREANKEQFAKNNLDPTIPDTSGHIMSKSDLPKTNKDLTDYYIAMHDDLHRVKQFQNDVVDAKGKPLPASEQPHTMALGTRGADVTADQMIKKNMVDMYGNKIEGVDPLKAITSQLKPSEYRDFRTYLVNRHAITRMSRGEKVFPDKMKMSPEKSAQVVAAYDKKYPKFAELANKLYDYNHALGDGWLVKGGFIPQSEYDHMIQENPDYVPMNRVFDPIEKNTGNQVKRGFLGQPKPIKKAPGSQRKIIDPIESTIENTAKYVKTVRNNQVGQILVKHLTENPKALKDWAEIVPTEKGTSQFSDAIGNGNLNEENLQNILDKFNESWDQKPNLEHGNVLPVMVDGKPVHVRVKDPRLLDAMTNLKPEQQNLIFKSIGEASRAFRVLTTGLNPYFTVKNSARDFVDAYTNSKTLPEGPHKRIATFSKDLLNAYWDVMTHKDSVQDFRNMGGGHASSVAADTKLLAKTKAQLVPSTTVNDLKAEGKKFATTRVMASKLNKAYQSVIGGIEHANNAIETAPRLAEYKRTVKQGGGTYDSKVQGVYNANDVTVNFNRRGKIAKQIDSLVPFFNASMQGIDKFGRTVGTAKGKYAARLATIGLPATLLYFANANDPNYQNMSKYIRDQNFLIPKGDGTFIKIAKPREIGAIMDGVERTLDALYQHDPHAWQDYGKTLWNNFFPPQQTVDQPLIDAYANTSFTGAPIVSQSLSGLAPKYQYDSKDTGFAKNVAKVTSALPLPEYLQSPKKIDYLLKSYGGGAAQLLTAPGQSAKNTAIADPVFSNDTTTNFYNEKTKLDQAHAVLNKKGITDPALNEPLRQQFDSQARQISKIRQVMNATNDPKQKRLYQQMINRLESQSNALVK